MPILFDDSINLFSLQTCHSTYQMLVGPYGFLLHLYYGAKIENQNLGYLIQQQDRGFSGNPFDAGTDRKFSLDTLPQEYPFSGSGDYREVCLAWQLPDGSSTVDLRYQEHRIFSGKTPLPGLPSCYGSDHEVQSLEIVMADVKTAMEVILQYSVFSELDIITRAVRIINRGTRPVILKRVLSCCVDFNIPKNYDILTFYGRHAMEHLVERTAVRHGKIRVDSVRGASSHQQNPFVILCDHDASEVNGNCYGLSFVYSGNFLAQVEKDQIDQIRLVMGLNPEDFQWTLDQAAVFQAPEVILGYSSNGFSALSHRFHALIRDHLCRGLHRHQRRPVIINNWEATYFNFDEKKLLSIARQAASLGIELFVLDDGWFGKRDDDTASLGDWYVNEKKIPSGLGGLARKINDLGLQFGLWLEPEMISEDSDLYREHPTWCFQVPGRKNIRSRHQLVLDLSQPEVIDYLHQKISGLLRSANISYIKWDMNRHMTDVYSAALPSTRQGEVRHRYIVGLYDLLERIIADFPDLLIESCSGGGGRFDAGLLYYSPQIWCSDNTDAIDRISIQNGTSFCYPISTIGSHVSACPNHQTGRSTPLSTRGIVAQTGAFGYELDLSTLSQSEQKLIKRQIDDFKRYSDLICFGRYDRLTPSGPCENYAAWMFVSEDQAEALVSFVRIRPQANSPQICICLRGLDADAVYLFDHGERIQGAALMNAGLVIPVLQGEYVSCQFHLMRVSDTTITRE